MEGPVIFASEMELVISDGEIVIYGNEVMKLIEKKKNIIRKRIGACNHWENKQDGEKDISATQISKEEILPA